MGVRWVDSCETIYPRWFEVTSVRVRELVDTEQDVEYNPVVRLETLLAPPASPTSSSTGWENSITRGPLMVPRQTASNKPCDSSG